MGHSTRTWGEFVALLYAFSIRTLCDIRAWPHSRKFPQFEGDMMREALAREGIAYHWMGKSLGGRRQKGLGASSPNQAIRSEGFRNYADHMRTESFREGLDELMALAAQSRTAVMCAEALSVRCHRWLLSDALVARGVRVSHIRERGQSSEHRLSRGAVVADRRVTYPATGELFD